MWNSVSVAQILPETDPPRLEEAEDWARRSVEIAARVTGRTSYESALAQITLGLNLKERGKYEESEKSLLESVSIDREAGRDRDALSILQCDTAGGSQRLLQARKAARPWLLSVLDQLFDNLPVTNEEAMVWQVVNH